MELQTACTDSSEMQGHFENAAAIWLSHEKAIRILVKKYLHQWQYMQDALHDIYLAIYQNIAKGKDIKNLEAFLRGIIKFTCWNINNDARRQMQSLDDAVSVEALWAPDDKPDSLMAIEDAERAEIVKKCMEQLSGLYYDVLFWRYYREYSYKEIGEKLKISTNYVGVLLRRSLYKISPCLAPQDEQQRGQNKSTK